ncbi:MAG: 4-alpha-glucanotransferase [Candidatus Omnitrophota bacterium]|jgi:4-alpha-glucanotransferase
MVVESKPTDFIAQKRAGILIPLFSIYSKNTFGCADFNDLKLAVDWIKETGSSMLQLLPMNEMGPAFCPYDALSSFALDPLYLSFLDLPFPKNRSIKRQIVSLKNNFSSSARFVDYAFKNEKMRLLREIFLMNPALDSKEWSSFKDANFYWLNDFALYKALKNYHQGAAWYDWEDKFKNRDNQALDKFREEHISEVNFELWLQWQAYEQFKEVKIYAFRKRILIKGDLPILVSRDSSDVWSHSNFFKLEFAAGAPPDMYCAKGQRWGMPTYNWEQIADDKYRYLKEKLKFAENFYDILRIDHVVGLFRIWSIPYNDSLENQGLNGSFDPAYEPDWGLHGRNILEVIQKSTKMFLCAEDLGVIPKVCTDALREFGIPGNDVGRWVKDWNIKHDFLDAQDYRQVSVSMLSTHDTTNWAAWWEYEAGTVDEALFVRKCSDHRGIGFDTVRDKLFDISRSCHGRLRWREEVNSVDKLIAGLSPAKAVPPEHLGDFVDLWKNSFHEKEKLWKHLGLSGAIREKCDCQIMQAVLRFSLDTSCVFCINTIFDWLYLAGLLEGDPYQYRINTPGTVSKINWSLKIPIPLEDLLKHKITREIREMVKLSSRV